MFALALRSLSSCASERFKIAGAATELGAGRGTHDCTGAHGAAAGAASAPCSAHAGRCGQLSRSQKRKERHQSLAERSRSARKGAVSRTIEAADRVLVAVPDIDQHNLALILQPSLHCLVELGRAEMLPARPRVGLAAEMDLGRDGPCSASKGGSKCSRRQPFRRMASAPALSQTEWRLLR